MCLSAPGLRREQLVCFMAQLDVIVIRVALRVIDVDLTPRQLIHGRAVA